MALGRIEAQVTLDDPNDEAAFFRIVRVAPAAGGQPTLDIVERADAFVDQPNDREAGNEEQVGKRPVTRGVREPSSFACIRVSGLQLTGVDQLAIVQKPGAVHLHRHL